MTTTHPFIAASTWQRDAANPARFTSVVDDAWLQGKGAFGGLLNAGTVRAMQLLVGDARRRIRTMNVHFCGPARPGPFACDVVVERAGATISTLSARVTQEAKAVTVVTATFALPRTSPNRAPGVVDAPGPSPLQFDHAPAPSLPAFDEAPPAPRDMPFLPAFTQFFEYRWCLGEIPFTRAQSPMLGGWLRFTEPLAEIDHAAIAALIDAYPPALLALLDTPRGSASVDMSIDFHVDAPLTGDAFTPSAPQSFIVRQSARVGDGGFTDERGELWTSTGRLVATSRQLVTVL